MTFLVKNCNILQQFYQFLTALRKCFFNIAIFYEYILIRLHDIKIPFSNLKKIIIIFITRDAIQILIRSHRIFVSITGLYVNGIIIYYTQKNRKQFGKKRGKN